MPHQKLRAALLAEHRELKRQTQELRLEHQRLSKVNATREERGAHRERLRRKRLELEQHYHRLRKLDELQHLDRLAHLAANNHRSPE
jgi:hypothetical protein